MPTKPHVLSVAFFFFLISIFRLFCQSVSTVEWTVQIWDNGCCFASTKSVQVGPLCKWQGCYSTLPLVHCLVGHKIALATLVIRNFLLRRQFFFSFYLRRYNKISRSVKNAMLCLLLLRVHILYLYMYVCVSVCMCVYAINVKKSKLSYHLQYLTNTECC